MSQYAHPEVLVDTQWLTDHLNDPKLRILEVNVSPTLYENAHIPGAVFWSIDTDLLLPDLRINLDPNAIASLFSRSGITPEMTVVAYGSFPGTSAWIFWLLKLFGHGDVRVLNGNHQKWISESRPISSELATVPATFYPVPQLDPSLRIVSSEVRSLLSQSSCVVLDVRTDQEYSGEVFLNQPPTGSERAGHIPGSVHIEHLRTFNEDGTFKSAAELQALYASQGITPDQEIIPYCAIGGRSGYTWFVLNTLLGYPKVRNYDGSWNEWSRLPDAPVEKS